MFSAVAPVSASRRALVRIDARRAHVASVHARCVLSVAVNPARSAFAWSSGAACWTQRGSCARRGCGLAWLDRHDLRAPLSAAATVAHRRLGVRRRSRVVGGSLPAHFAVEHEPNPALNRTWRYVASTWHTAVAPRRLAFR